MNADKLRKGLKNPQLVASYLQGRGRAATRAVLRGTELARARLLDAIYGPNEGLYVMEQDWDNLIILDACRYDAFARVNDIPGTLTSVTSRGGATAEFLQENFTRRTDYDTVFVSGNAVVGSEQHHLDVFKLIGLWGSGSRDANDNTSPYSVADPEPVVEKTLELHEEYPHKRIVSHLLPPHTPYLVKDGSRLPSSSPYRTFTAVRRGQVSESEMRAVYEENVEYVLGYVRELLDGLDGKTIITADHGELLGEGVPWYVRVLHSRWGPRQLGHYDYAHYDHVHEPALVTVPWLEIEGDTRRRIHDAQEPEGVEMDETAIESQLEALGYR